MFQLYFFFRKMDPKPKQIRFRPEMDIALLREYIALTPFKLVKESEKTKSWKNIVEVVNAVQAGVTERSCKKRVKALLDAFSKDELESLKA